MYRLLKRICAVIVTAAMMAVCIAPVSSEETKRIVRVACGFNDFLYLDEDGEAMGFYAEYINKLAEVGSWQYEYIETGWSNAVEMLESGEIDLLFPTNYTEDRESVMDFSDIPIGYTATGIFSLKDNNYDYEDYSSFDGARVAIGKSSVNEFEFEAFSKEHGFSYESVYCTNNEEMIDAVRQGKADLVVFSAANDFPNGVLLAVMESKPVYFSVKEGNTELLNLVNRAMEQLISTEPELISDVLNKTMIGNNSAVTAFTTDEWEFIRSQHKIRVGFYEETEPLAYIKDDGGYGGVYIELLENIKSNSGLNIELVPISRSDHWRDLVKNGDIDFYVGASGVIITDNKEFRSTDPLMEYSNILITRNDCVFNRIEKPVIALTYGRSYWADYVTQNIVKEAEIKYYNTSKDCMIAVSEGEADASIINNLEYNYHSKNDRLSNIMQLPQYRFPTDVVLSASDNVDPMVFSVMNKAVNMLSAEFADEVVDECLNMPYHSYSLFDTLYNARFFLLLFVALMALAVVIIIAFVIYRRHTVISHERERHHLQVLAALSRNYVGIYYSDLDTDSCEILQVAEPSKSRISDCGSHSKLLSEYVDTFVLPEYREVLRPFCDPEKIKRIFEGNKFAAVRYRAPSKDNNMDYFEMYFVDVSDDDKEHKMVLGVRCIDEIIKEEQTQQKLLQEALDGANRANASKSEFLSRMSHDIRTPMNAIIGMTAIAEAHAEEPDRVRDSLVKIGSASRHLLGLINEVLDMSKIESGKMSLNEEEIVLSELVNDMVDMIHQQVEEHKHKLSVDISGIIHDNVIGDALHIQQAFINIISNAVKYTPDGGMISVRVSENPIETGSVGCYEFVIADNGIGMTKEVMDHIFDPFERAEDLRISKIQGTGLGLPITLNIVQMMNGSIQVESEPNKGSAFTMTIFLTLQEDQQPVKKKYAENGEELPLDSNIEEFEKNSFEGKRILLVEDNMLNREIAKEILEMAGIEVEEAEDGKQSVEMFSASEYGYYNAVLMDIQMPVMNGYEATRAIRKLDRPDAAVPIIALTANAFVEDIQQAKDAGMTAHLAKPIDFAKLSKVLRKHLK